MTSTSGPAILLTQPRMPASPPIRTRVEAAEAAANPLLEAARPLLDALADTPVVLDGRAVEMRYRWLSHEVRVFDKACAELRLRPDHVQNTRYCLCSALDEAAMQTAWGKGVSTGVEWTTHGLAVAFGGDRQGGDRVYAIIEQAMLDPLEHRDLIEVIQKVLDLGFKGRYRFASNGQAELEAVRRQLHNAAATTNRSAPARLAHTAVAASALTPSPRDHVDPEVRLVAAAPRRKAYLRVALALVLVALLGFVTYAGFHTRVDEPRPARLAKPADVLARNLADLLKNEIAAGTVGLMENARQGTIKLRFDDMFLPGETSVNAWVAPLIAIVGREVAPMPVTVRVTGYTDSLPVARSSLASNQTLSEERAKQVMQILLAAGLPSDRVIATGKGDEEPIAANDTPHGRMKNRRVEIMVTQ